ncbi:hypothetical protein ASD54_13350 [Rhizobium sp. Root149]|uniref:hypothetical protein n=1 Tax=Rhizobium sp. Root149 TaxID=1736473 RepID=UPI0007137B7A|nr:hypothetical protein [Rhizobium sp. Root149]KQZ49895.1 hypothetical protein ASD54_13350 [Rhizobium sp. Root149]
MLSRRLFCATTLTIAAFGAVAQPVKAAGTDTIYYNSSGNKEKTLGFEVLKLALEKSGKSYALKPSPTGYSSNAGMVDAIANGAQIDIAWVNASKAVSSKLLSVPFPVDMGLGGYRLFLIDSRRQAEFSTVRNLQGLKNFIALQGTGWADVDVLRKSNLTVRTGPQKNLYRMTIGKRGDYFARGVNEALNEQAKQVAELPDLSVETSLVLQYPSASIFYVSKARPELRDDLMRGLEAAWKDGSFQKTFLSNPDIKLALDKGNLKSRTIIKIPNPNLPEDILAMDERYWFKP